MTRFMKVLALGEDTYYALLHGGGGKGAAPAQVAQVAPTAPVQEASVEIDEDADKKKLKTTKESLKIPLAETVDTGLKV